MQCIYVHFFPRFINSLPLPTVAQCTHTHTHTHTLYYFGSHDMLSPDIMTLPPKHLFCLPQKQRPSTELHDHYHTECNKQ